MFDIEQAKKQVDAVPKLALPYFLDACDEVERLRAALQEIETLRPFLEMGREAEGWKHLAGRRREIARDALREETRIGRVTTP